MKNLPLQVREVDTVEIDQSDSADTGCCQIQRDRGSETASAHEQDTRRFQAALAHLAHLRQQNVAAVAQLFLAAKLGSGVGASRIHGVVYCAEIPGGTTNTLTNAAPSSNAAERRDE